MGYYESDLQIVKTLISTQQTEEAARLLQHLIRQRPDGEAYAMLGDLYSLGKGVEQNSDKACECFENAAKKGHVGAMRATAEMNYRGGLIHKPSFSKATEWYHKAADMGDRESMYMAGICDLLCESEESRPKNRSEKEDLLFWQSGIDLLARSGDERANTLLQYTSKRLPRRMDIPVMTVHELYKRLHRDEQHQKYIYRGQTQT